MERADTFDSMSASGRPNLLAVMDDEMIADMMMIMSEASKAELLSAMGSDRRTGVFSMLIHKPELQAVMSNAMPPADCAELFENLSHMERGGLLAVLDSEHKAALFVQLPQPQQRMVLATLVHERKMQAMFQVMTPAQQAIVISA